MPESTHPPQNANAVRQLDSTRHTPTPYPLILTCYHATSLSPAGLTDPVVQQESQLQRETPTKKQGIEGCSSRKTPTVWLIVHVNAKHPMITSKVSDS